MKVPLDAINVSPKTLEEATGIINQLLKIVHGLKEEIELLREKLNNDSNNSSLPPSQDRKKKKKSKAKSGRHRGGQPGHPGWQRKIVPFEELDAIVDCKPSEKCACGGAVVLKEEIKIHQVFEIPVARYEVTEYRIYQGCCDQCGQKSEGNLPEGVSFKGFGARAHAMVSLLTSKYRLSKRLVTAWFKDVYHLPICLGSVSNVEHTVSQSLQAAHEEVFSAVKAAQVVHVDETSHKENYQNGWAWIASAADYTYFGLSRSRGKKVARELIGDYQNRIIITDRYGAYNFLPDQSHQICWAHLKRDFQKIAERTGQAGRIGRKLLSTYQQLFGFWKTEYQEELKLSRKQRKRLRYFKSKLLKWLAVGVHCDHQSTARTCDNILGLQGSLWHFFENPQVPTTNNHAERQLRPLVISKKLTFGTQSPRGSRFIERIFTVVMTCQQQGRDVLSFTVEAVRARFSGQGPPSLLLDTIKA
jgi:transposase